MVGMGGIVVGVALGILLAFGILFVVAALALPALESSVEDAWVEYQADPEGWTADMNVGIGNMTLLLAVLVALCVVVKLGDRGVPALWRAAAQWRRRRAAPCAKEGGAA